MTLLPCSCRPTAASTISLSAPPIPKSGWKKTIVRCADFLETSAPFVSDILRMFSPQLQLRCKLYAEGLRCAALRNESHPAHLPLHRRPNRSMFHSSMCSARSTAQILRCNGCCGPNSVLQHAREQKCCSPSHPAALHDKITLSHQLG